ncbi:MAG: helix-turn-helix domain-containing protein [Oscillospiraceae bacterium]
MITVKDILTEITRLRLERKWTEYQLSERSGIPQSTISGWYRKKQTPTMKSLKNL